MKKFFSTIKNIFSIEDLRVRILNTIGFLIIFIICFGYYIYINKNSGFKFATLQNKTNTEQETNNTSDWKIYKNNEYGFEFQYPGDWNMSSMESN